jgi:hypothetical protein
MIGCRFFGGGAAARRRPAKASTKAARPPPLAAPLPAPPPSYLMLLRMFFKACAGARDAQKKAVYQECVPKLGPSLTALLAILDGPNCSEVRAGRPGSGRRGLAPRQRAPPRDPTPFNTP